MLSMTAMMSRWVTMCGNFDPRVEAHHFDQQARSRAAVDSAPPRFLLTRTRDRRAFYASCQRTNHSSQRTPPTATLAGNSTACRSGPV